jgi:sugar phosphate isomerase/epimerase
MQYWVGADVPLNDTTMKVSFGSWAFSFGPYATRPVGFFDIALKLSQAGYDGIEACGFAPHITLEDYPDEGSRRAVARRLADMGLAVSGYSADLTLVNPTLAGNKALYLDLVERNIDMCAALGSPGLRVDTCTAPGIIPDEEAPDVVGRLAEVWHTAADLALRSGVRVLWEFEPGFAFNKPSEVVAIHKAVGHPNFAILFDTAHAHMCSTVCARQAGKVERLGGGVAEMLRLCEGRVGHLHLVDSDGTLHGEETSAHRPFGEGEIPFFKLADRLRATGVEWWCVDLCFCEDSWSAVEPSLRFVRSLQRAGL